MWNVVWGRKGAVVTRTSEHSFLAYWGLSGCLWAAGGSPALLIWEQDPKKLNWGHERKPGFLQGCYCMVLSWKDLEIPCESTGKLGLFCGSLKTKQNKTKSLLLTPQFKVSLYIESILYVFCQVTHLDWITRVGLGPSAAALDTTICSLTWRGSHGAQRQQLRGAEKWGGDRPEREVHTHRFPSIWWSDMVPSGTDEIPKELQYSFQLRLYRDYCKFIIVGQN